MRAMFFGVGLVLLTGSVMAADAGADDKARLQGEWRLKDVKLSSGDDRATRKVHMTFDGDKVTGTIDVGAVAELNGSYVLAPPHLTMTVARPLAGGNATIKYLYSFEAEVLVLCRFDDNNAATAAPSSCTEPNVRRLDLVRAAE